MWLIEALKQDYDVTVVTTGGWNLYSLNGYYGTWVKENEVTVRIASVPFLLQSLNAAALLGACYQRFARQIAGDYDIRISAYNMTDWGLPAFQFIADFSWHQGINQQFHPRSPGFIYRNTVARRAYLKLARAYETPSGRDVLRDDPLIANSHWTAALMKQYCNVDCAAVIYPSVWTELIDLPWEEKEQAFAMIGRIAPEKQVERAIAILEAVRQRGHAIRLHICGEIENNSYGRYVAQLCGKRKDWIVLEGQVTGTRKAQVLAQCRYGIQTSGAEGFGISVAEMIRAGAIAFASNCGGQTEILDSPDLLFVEESDAIDKVCSVLSSPQKQLTLRAHLARRSEMFSAARFVEETQTLLKIGLPDAPSLQEPRHRPKIVIGHPRLGLGGSESTVMWLIEALKHNFDVTVLTTGGWDLLALNNYYGTQINKEDVKVRIAPVPYLVHGLHAAALRGACYQRFANTIAGEYDIRISAYNPTDWGLPAIHFIADFSWNRRIREQFHPPSPGFIYRDTPARSVYLKIASAYGKPSGRDFLHDDLLIANSHWTAATMKQFCDVDCAAVIYPSVWAMFSNVPWAEKQQAFAMIGRIAPEKQIEQAIAILETVRERGHAIRLHLCGQIEDDPYGRQIAQLCRERADWIILEGQVTGEGKTEILSHCRFGIQTCSAEGFGISVAEMIKAGAIVFANSDGGQAEILGHPELLFSDTNDAVEKILAVLEKPTLKSALRNHLAHQAQRFSAQAFVHETQAFIAELLTPNQRRGCEVTSRA